MTFELAAVMRRRGLDVAFTVSPGETVALLGTNGAGKSTIVELCAGLLRPARCSRTRRRSSPGP